MSPTDRLPRRYRRWRVLAMVVVVVLAAGTVPPDDVTAAAPALPLGDVDLTETRTVQTLAPGVSLTQIVRGTLPAAPAEIATTTRGPWRVNVLTIDPTLARGHLAATYGRNLSQVETTTSLVQSAGALAGVNASYFTTADKSRAYPGDPVGLGLYRGILLSEPAAVRSEVDLVIDARTTKLLIGRLTWSGKLKNRRTGATLKLKHLNHPPVVPAKCRKLKNPTKCKKSGAVVRFRPAFGPTPRGKGVEVVLDKSGCVVRRVQTRGHTLLPGQTSVQATGKQSRSLWRLTKRGCLTSTVRAYREGKRLKLTRTMFGVAGRYHLTRKGRIAAPTKTGRYFNRNPRTIAGTTSDGKVMLVTIDGRRPTSVGATITETASVARSLGMTESLNLDGGGSTAMSVGGVLVNQPSGSAERAVGDALIYVDRPL
ncbi:MAG: phosphodiester glycosidase family protein [Microlunatus sp.]